MNTHNTYIHIQKAIGIVGSQTRLAKLLGICQQTVSKWVHGTSILPPRQALKIEKLTKGAVTRHELRPDIYPEE